MKRLVIFCLFFFLAWCPSNSADDFKEEELIGWQGETYKPKNYQKGAGSKSSQTINEPWIQTISWKPRAFVYHNFLSKQEMIHIIELASKQMKRSQVVGANNSGVVDNYRTSYGTFLRRNQDSVITAIEERLAVWSQLPPSHQEDLQVLRYAVTNKYGPHTDGLGRVASVLMYIVAPEEGGETAFTEAKEWSDPALAQKTGPLSACAQGHVAYKPVPGDALMFFDKQPDYLNEDIYSTHTGCPVVKGVKWNAVKWIHGIPFQEDAYNESLVKPFVPLPDPGVCADRHEMCETWAVAGECEKNAGYMLGADFPGTCMRACKACELCVEGDVACYGRNRAQGGFLNLDPNEVKHLYT